MKKIITMFLVISMLAASVGCGNGHKGNTSEKKKSSTEASTGKNSKTEKRTEENAYMPLEIVKSEWFINEIGYLEYCVTARNPNSDITVEDPILKIVAKDKEGGILEAGEWRIWAELPPGREIMSTGIGHDPDEEPASVEFSILYPEVYRIKTGVTEESFTPLEVKNLNVRGETITGVIRNHNGYRLDEVAVIVLLRDQDGNLIDVLEDHIHGVLPGEENPFSMRAFSIKDYDSIECFASPL